MKLFQAAKMSRAGLILLFSLLFSHGNQIFAQQSGSGAHGEVIYHVFQRSFYDSNGDMHGDFNGLREKLDYLQQLGVTSILLLPTCQSDFYHNYFSSDFEKLDPRYGTMDDWLGLVKDIHRRKMKIYLDMEPQYVTQDHLWYRESYNNPTSQYSNYLLYKDSTNKETEPLIFGITALDGYNGVRKNIAVVNLRNHGVQNYMLKVFSGWVDPNHDGMFDDGVDGFRLDHMMDELDGKPRLNHLFDSLWVPLFTKLKKINPNLKNVAEQANWGSLGKEYFTDGGVDRVFAFRLQQAIASFDKSKLETIADSTFSITPSGKDQVVFIENHDMDRFSTQVKNDPGKLRVGAGLNLLIGGIPSIYYGQELGMFGSGGFQKFGNSDANDIPRREAFEWFKADTGRGMCLWYKDTGPWWDRTNLKPDDGVSLEEEQNDPNSLWNFYKTLIHLRENSDALSNGRYRDLKNNNDHVFSFLRTTNKQKVAVVINLSDQPQNSEVDLSGSTAAKSKKFLLLFGNETAHFSSGKISFQLSPYSIQVMELK